MKACLIDNFDSFTFNLFDLILRSNLGLDNLDKSNKLNASDFLVVRNNESIDIIRHHKPDFLFISPGPGAPKDSKLSMRAIEEYYNKIPLFGVCLGMQCLNEFFGGSTVESNDPCHGKTVSLESKGSELLEGLPAHFQVARYHSLKIIPDYNNIQTQVFYQEIPMVIRHSQLPLWGVQFHPESFLTEGGEQIIKNFFRLGRVFYERKNS